MNEIRMKALWMGAIGLLALPLGAQKVENRPATDSSALASPTVPAPKAPSTDSATESSPALGPAFGSGVALRAGEAVRVKLDRAIDSGHLKNGENVPARLVAPVRTTSGATLPAGTAVEVSVVETLPAGRLAAEGEFSLQVVRVGRVTTATDFKVYRGQPGPKEIADAAPKVGTDAGLPAGAEIEFRVLNPTAPAEAKPAERAEVPGSVNGVASGSPPPPSARTNSGEPVFGGANAQNGNKTNGQARAVEPANNTFQPAQHTGQASPAPNQPSAPQNTNQGSSTQPR